MYLLQFVNRVREAQCHDGLERLPAKGADGSTPVELAMGCRFEGRMMRLTSPQAAAAVADLTGLEVGTDRMTVAVPRALDGIAGEVQASRLAADRPRTSAQR